MPESAIPESVYQVGRVEPSRLRTVLAANVREIAARKKLALNHLADRAGVSRSQTYAVLACEAAPTTDWLAKVALALEVEPWMLLKPPRNLQTITPSTRARRRSS